MMKLCRFFLICLAIIAGLIGAVWALSGPVIFLYVTVGVIRERAAFGDTSVVAGVIAISIIMSIVGVLIVRQAWIHLRRPNRATARVIVGIATFLLGVVTYHVLKKEWGLFASNGQNDPKVELLFSLGVLLFLYLGFRLLGKRLAEWAFPMDARPET